MLRSYLKKHPDTSIRIIKQTQCQNTQDLQNFFKAIEKKGGEGAVIRDPNAPYINQRTDRALKVKSFEDAECRVTGYKQGEGKYAQKIGALECKLNNKRSIYIGSGLSDLQRENPPKIGTLVTFKYNGLTKNGLPRFPVFLRIRNERK